ncbi:dnaJ homolog subfamily B member 6-like isoform X3 [Fagus crenata]
MANGEEKSNNDLYAVLGLEKECTASELRNAYKKLALRWHPDRCSASGNSKFAEEAKQKFQAIQQAYSVLSDSNKRFLYDVGVYDSDDDENGMGDFLNEMAVMMSQTKSNNENGEESFEELQELFEELLQGNTDTFGSSSQTTTRSTSSATCTSYCESSSSNNKRNTSEMNFGKTDLEGSSGFNANFQNFCFGSVGTPTKCHEGGGSKKSFRRSQR